MVVGKGTELEESVVSEKIGGLNGRVVNIGYVEEVEDCRTVIK